MYGHTGIRRREGIHTKTVLDMSHTQKHPHTHTSPNFQPKFPDLFTLLFKPVRTTTVILYYAHVTFGSMLYKINSEQKCMYFLSHSHSGMYCVCVSMFEHVCVQSLNILHFVQFFCNKLVIIL